MLPGQTAELCEAATAEVGAADGVRIANFLVSGNYAVSGGVAGCDALERLAKSFKVCAFLFLSRQRGQMQYMLSWTMHGHPFPSAC